MIAELFLCFIETSCKRNFSPWAFHYIVITASVSVSVSRSEKFGRRGGLVS